MKIYPGLQACVLALLCQACSSISDPNNHYAEQAQAAPGTISQWQQSTDSGVTVTSLLQLVNLNQLDALVSEALSHNPGLQQTLVTLKKSRVQETTAAAEGRPQISAGVQNSRSENSNSTYTTSVDISWELDLWNRIGDSISAAQWQSEQASSDYQAAQNTLAASVIQAYLQIISQQQLLTIEQQRLQVLQNSESVILTRYRSGLGTLDDLDTARTSSASTRATIADYENSLRAARRSLAVLLGRTDMDTSDINSARDFPDIVPPLSGIPEQDLARRPDLQSAFAQIKASEASEQVAYKNLLPSLNISAALSDSGQTPALSFFKDPVWSLLGSVTAPLFQGGALKASLKQAKLDSLNTWWAYQQTLLTAVQEVEDTLDRETSYQIRQSHLLNAYDNAQRSKQTYTSQYRQGLVDILDLLSVTQTTYDLKAQLVQLQQNQLSNRIDLGLALGLGVSS